MLEFQTKARNLQSLKPRLKSAKILPLIITSLKNLKQNEKEVLAQISSLKAEKLIIRSSSKGEDNENFSNAGAFLSLANIKANDRQVLLQALFKVASSMPFEDDEILIQPCLEKITLCGVGFSADKDNLAPYFCLQYDESGSNDSITSGAKAHLKSFYHYKFAPLPKEEKLAKLIRLINELESLFKYEFLDIEFAFAKDKKGEERLFCLQVRPLSIQGKPNFYKLLSKQALERLYKRLKGFDEIKPRILGKKAVFGVMPDWNPAEIIGLRPKPLAFSLYKEIITDNIWAYQRDNYGYKDLRSHPLMHSFLGMPFIDVRLSFNSFVPKSLDEKLAQKLVNFYLQSLINAPNLHDKIEFEIVFSCYDLNTGKKLLKLLKHGFNENEIKRLEFSLLELTNQILDSKNGLYLKDIAKTKKLIKAFNELKSSKLSLFDKIYWLLEECKRYGTLPFAGVASTFN